MTDDQMPPATSPDVDTDCGERLKNARQHLGLTTVEATEQANRIILEDYPDAATDGKEPMLSERTLRQWESKRNMPRLGRRFRALAKLYRQSPGWLSIGEGVFHEFDPSTPAGNGSGSRDGHRAEGDEQA